MGLNPVVVNFSGYNFWPWFAFIGGEKIYIALRKSLFVFS